MKKFDWAIAHGQRGEASFNFIRSNFLKPLTEEEFIKGMQAVRNLRIGKSKHYSPSRLKREYNNLKGIFGFFTG